VPEVNLSFFVSKEKLLFDEKSRKQKNAKKSEVDAKDPNGYLQVDVQLESLRADISYNLRQRHYTEAVRALNNTLDQASIEMEERDGG